MSECTAKAKASDVCVEPSRGADSRAAREVATVVNAHRAETVTIGVLQGVGLAHRQEVATHVPIREIPSAAELVRRLVNDDLSDLPVRDRTVFQQRGEVQVNAAPVLWRYVRAVRHRFDAVLCLHESM